MDQDQLQRIRTLIDDLELCHHKAERHVALIVEAIGGEHTAKGYRAREHESGHPATRMWQNAMDILAAWVAGDTATVQDLDVGGHSGKELAALLGARTDLKKWQVQRVIEKLTASSRMHPGSEYHEIVEHPERYADSREFQDRTVRTTIRDTRDGQPAAISLAAAIDHLQPCNWNFAENLVIVLSTINGRLTPAQPFAAHGRNAGRNPIRNRMLVVANTLAAFCGRPREGETDRSVLDVLGQRTADKAALATALQEKIDSVFGQLRCAPK